MSEPRNTRERIRHIAMELFSQHGYDRTSLREIAENLGLTKAALYYHFKTKEDIATSFFDDFLTDVEELRDWAEDQPSGLPIRREILRRYSEVLRTHVQTLVFMHHNMPTLQHLNRGRDFKESMRQLQRLLLPAEPDPVNRLRAVDAIMTMHMAWFIDVDGCKPEDLREPALRIATELIDANGP